MTTVTVLRCPISPTVREYARQVALALCDEFGTEPRVTDGLPGEFVVIVGGREVYCHDGKSPLPTPAQIVGMVKAA